MKFFSMLLGVFILVFAAQAQTGVRINEFMASNDTTIDDGDGNSSDWIELYNAGPGSVDISGWFLTDKESKPHKWAFPANTIIPVNGYLVVFASNKKIDNYVDPGGYLHTNFKLSSSGEYLALIKYDSTIVSEFKPEFPSQYTDVSYGYYSTNSFMGNLIENSNADVYIPTNNVLSNTWIQTSFSPGAGWLTNGIGTGVGYDTHGGYDPEIDINIQTELRYKETSAYIRIPFTLTDVNNIESLFLHIHYDDGFYIYLNGDEILRRNAPEIPAWNNTATNVDENANTIDVDISVAISALQNGENVLAIHGMNASKTSSDFLMNPALTAIAEDGLQIGYFSNPTPGAANTTGAANPGPGLKISHLPLQADSSENIVVTALVTERQSAVSQVQLHYRIRYGSEITVSMTDQGSGRFVATIPSSAYGSEEMVRWYVTATDLNANASRAPLFLDQIGTNQSAEYFGVVTSGATSDMPLLQWFCANVSASRTRSGTRASVWFRGRFYDNIFVRQRGGYSNGSSQKFDFNRGNSFYINEELSSVGEINMNGKGEDNTYVRQPLSFDTHREAEVPSCVSELWQMRVNGSSDRVGVFIEQVDEDFLKRYDYDPTGDLYKFIQRSNILPVFSDTLTGVEKKTNDKTDFTTMDQLIAGLNLTSDPSPQRRAYLMDHLDVAEIANYLAARAIITDIDDTRKNFYMYLDLHGDDRWRIFPWDKDWTFGIRATSAYGDYNHPFYCDEEHKKKGQWNILYDVFFEETVLQRIYLRRLRTLMDTILQPASTPLNERFLETRAAEIIDPASPPLSSNLSSINNFLNTRRNAIFNNYPGLIPATQPSSPVITISAVDVTPASSNPDEEYIKLSNSENTEIDLSGWRIEGGVNFIFPPGTVIERNGNLYVSPDTLVFRNRATSPKGGEQHHVTGPYSGHLNARGETFELKNTLGVVVDTWTIPSNPTIGQQTLRISEIMYGPADPTAAELNVNPYFRNTDFEFIELVNTGTVALDMSGARFVKGVLFTFPAGYSIPPGGYAVIAANTTAFPLRYGASIPLAGQYSGILDNKGETIVLYDSEGEKVLDFSYNNTWYPITDGHDFSLVIRDASADWSVWGKSASWRSSSNRKGSPGTADPTPPAIGQILINEALTHTDFPEIDTIELFNPESASVNIGGWFLTDNLKTPRKFRIPNNTQIAPGGYLVYDEDDFYRPNTNAPTSFQLNSHGDDVWLFSADTPGNLTGYLHGFEFGAAENGVSFGRYVSTDGKEQFPAQSGLSFGAGNLGPKVGPVVISEIMYHPPDLSGTNNVRDEYIELTNISGASVPLYDPLATTNIWHLRKAVDFDFPQGSTIAAGQSVLVVGFSPTNTSTLASFRSAYGLSPAVTIYGPWIGTLNNSGEAIKLKWPDKPDATMVPYVLTDKVSYKPAEPWPADADGTGSSLQRIKNSKYGNDPDNWYAAPPRPGQSANLDVDTDDDSMTDWQEWKARTDPDDPDSVMRTGDLTPAPAGGLNLHLLTVSGRCYAVDYSTNLVTHPFTPLIEGLEAVGDTIVIPVTNSLGRIGYYRMRLDPGGGNR